VKDMTPSPLLSESVVCSSNRPFAVKDRAT
jgi:hypothetical protein